MTGGCPWAFTLLALCSATASADTTFLCMDTKGTAEAHCTCASEAQLEQIGAEQSTHYETVGDLYLANTASGQSMADALNGAITSTAVKAGVGHTALLTRMNVSGTAHRGVIKGCK